MPQLFQVLRCYKCLVFQVHQTKKANKFQCKMCGEKQSIKRHYGLGNGQECRLHVQKLNGLRGKLTEEEVVTSENFEEELEHKETKINAIEKIESSKSKWSAFVSDENNIAQNENEISYSNNEDISSENPKRRKKYRGSTQNLILMPQETFIDKRKFETSYKCKENVDRTIQEKCNQETGKILVSKQTCNIFSDNLNNIQGSVKAKSNWVQFGEHQEQLHEPGELHSSKSNSSTCKTNNLFELCDDADLDNILNI